jgi:pimeloyl-ACP methyl ester carboxylesterase
MAPPRLIPGAGHWVQQEAAAEVTAALIDFLNAPG